MSQLPSLGPRGEGWVAIQGVLLALVALGGLAGPAWSGTGREAAGVAGGVLMLAGGILASRGLFDLRSALTALPHPRDDASMVASGAYRFVRHPIYGGIVAGAAGYGLVAASPFAIVGAAVLLGFFRLKSSKEEAWLEARYPDYPAYRARTRRMLPWLY